jgi:hypothetical protein
VADGRRGRGIGTQMLNEAARFMSDRVDAMFVIRGGERSDGYRFYRRTGHGDLMYARWYVLPPEITWPAAEEGQAAGGRIVSSLDRQRWLELEPELLALHERQYGGFGGGQERAPGFWRHILDSHVYREGDPAHKWWLLALSSASRGLAGYLVAAQGSWAPTRAVFIYEVVGESEAAVEQLIRYARRFVPGASESGQGASGGEQEAACDQASSGEPARYGAALVSLANPVCAVLERMGFVAGESTSHIMARILRPERIFARLAAETGLLDTLALSVATPHRTVTVNEPAAPRYTVRLETKENFMSRLFCCRLDLEAALDMELVRWSGATPPDPGLQSEVSRVFGLCEWTQWFSEFV